MQIPVTTPVPSVRLEWWRIKQAATVVAGTGAVIGTLAFLGSLEGPSSNPVQVEVTPAQRIAAQEFHHRMQLTPPAAAESEPTPAQRAASDRFHHRLR
jgi:hypothetical protein